MSVIPAYKTLQWTGKHHSNRNNSTHNMKVFLSLLTLALSAAASVPGYGAPGTYDQPPVYNYQYAVKDDYTGTNYEAAEQREGAPTSGSYSVDLPDGRTQIVTYNVADAHSGYVADVSYSGKAQYADEPTYKPATKQGRLHPGTHSYTPAPAVYTQPPVVYTPAPCHLQTYSCCLQSHTCPLLSTPPAQNWLRNSFNNRAIHNNIKSHHTLQKRGRGSMHQPCSPRSG
eukprot:TRINITY_DN32546_c0_g1_i1.p1 TRINITY_DN32546_c0_g1~~TRINITY_DN32546_c0_g1_i1.p1  ORF type:complete len:228 (+),score=32.65 TRINITY_DN32546_c0_g1_i1:79-762(+)